MTRAAVEPLLEFRRICKGFFGVPVVRNLSLVLGRGRVLGLVGENGAGKSTLMNLLGGVHQPDSGDMVLDGQPHAPSRPRAAALAGIAFIHQELNLFSNLTIAENLHVDHFPCIRAVGISIPLVDRRRMLVRSRELLEGVELDLDPDTLVSRLSPGQRQLVEIARAIGSEARLIILDEPTTSLSAPECEHLFRLLRRLRERGTSMIFISHTLGDVFDLCDDIAVLCDGRLVSQGPRPDYDHDRLVSEMVGRTPAELTSTRTVHSYGVPILEVAGLSRRPSVHGVEFSLRVGEILGLAGLMGAGRTELARLLFGLDPIEDGEIRLRGKPFVPSPRASIRAGIAFLTENRREEGLMMDAGVLENATLVALRAFARTPLRWIAGRAARVSAAQALASVRLRFAGSFRQAARTLSGGNQQKVVLAKWLLAQPSVIILDEPTRGIDIAAKHEVHGIIDSLAARGAAVLVISSEIEELISLCDRILVMASGRIRDEVKRPEFDRERILRAALRIEHAAEANP